MEKVKETLDGGFIEIHHKSAHKVTQAFEFRMQKLSDVVWLLENITPFLIVKRKVAEITLEFAKSRLKRSRYRYNNYEKQLRIKFERSTRNTYRKKLKPSI